MDTNNQLIPVGNIIPSSTEPGKTPEDLRLDGADAWSPDPSDPAPSVVINLDRPVRLTGVVLQGGGPNNPEEYVKTFEVEYSTDGVNYFPVTIGNIPLVSLVSSI